MDDSFQELAPALDLDALRREADARNARAVRAEMGTTIPGTDPAATAARTDGGRGGALDGIDGDGEDGKKKRKPVFSWTRRVCLARRDSRSSSRTRRILSPGEGP